MYPGQWATVKEGISTDQILTLRLRQHPKVAQKHPNFERLQNANRFIQWNEIDTKGSPWHQLLGPFNARLISRMVAEPFPPRSGANFPNCERITIWPLAPSFWAFLDCKVLKLLGRDRDPDLAWDVRFKLLFELSGYVERRQSHGSYMEDRITVVQNHFTKRIALITFFPGLQSPAVSLCHWNGSYMIRV